jgi:hypothetical protein
VSGGTTPSHERPLLVAQCQDVGGQRRISFVLCLPHLPPSGVVVHGSHSPCYARWLGEEVADLTLTKSQGLWELARGCEMRQHELFGSRVQAGLATTNLSRRNVAEFSKVRKVKGFVHIDGS